MPAPTVGNDEDQERRPEGQTQGPNDGQGEERGILAINKNFAANASTIMIMPSQTGMVAALMDKDGNTIGANPQTGNKGLVRTSDPMPTVKVEDGKKVTIDTRALNNSGNSGLGSGIQELTLKTDSRSEILLTNFTGRPPVRVEKGSDVDVEASSFMGFKNAGPGPDGKPTVTSAKVTFERAQDGSLIVMRDGQPAMLVPKDTKIDLKDKDGNTIMTIDSNKDVEDIKKAYLDAEKKAFKEFQKNAPDRSIRDATFRSGSEPAPAVSGPAQGQGQAPAQGGGMVGSLGSLSGVGQQVFTGLQGQASNLGQQALNSALPRIPGITGGGRGGAGT